MGRILAIDYGRKRTGLAVTDPLRICATGLPTLSTSKLPDFLKQYCEKETVDIIVIGEPKDLQGNPSESMKYITPFIKKLNELFPGKSIVLFDERFTSSIAHREMLAGGFRKTQRQEKGRADEMAAVIILNSFLESRVYQELLEKENGTSS